MAGTYEQVKSSCLESGDLWTDPDFPATNSSLFREPHIRPLDLYVLVFIIILTNLTATLFVNLILGKEKEPFFNFFFYMDLFGRGGGIIMECYLTGLRIRMEFARIRVRP